MTGLHDRMSDIGYRISDAVVSVYVHVLVYVC